MYYDTVCVRMMMSPQSQGGTLGRLMILGVTLMLMLLMMMTMMDNRVHGTEDGGEAVC